MAFGTDAHSDRFEPLSGTFLVGDVLAAPARNRIGQGACARTVQPRVMDLLCVLAAAPGRTFSREDLIRHVWEGIVVGPAAIDRTVCCLRKALGDCARRPIYVETIRKKGIRLMAPVRLHYGDDAPKPRMRAPEFSLHLAGRQVLTPGAFHPGGDNAASVGFRLVN